jgi:hypothetical protein
VTTSGSSAHGSTTSAQPLASHPVVWEEDVEGDGVGASFRSAGRVRLVSEPRTETPRLRLTIERSPPNSRAPSGASEVPSSSRLSTCRAGRPGRVPIVALRYQPRWNPHCKTGGGFLYDVTGAVVVVVGIGVGALAGTHGDGLGPVGTADGQLISETNPGPNGYFPAAGAIRGVQGPKVVVTPT